MGAVDVISSAMLDSDRGRTIVRPFALALLAAGGLMAFYLGLITFAQGWAHATEQLVEDQWFISAIMVGFGAQVGLLTYLRGLHARSAGAGAGMAASTGTSTAAMLACCAHHLADLLPVIGLSGAAIFLNDFKTPLLWLGIAMNAAGVLYLLLRIRRQHRVLCHAPAGHPEGVTP